MYTFVTNLKKALFVTIALLLAVVWQSWTAPEHAGKTSFSNSTLALQVIGSWNRLLPSQRTTLENGGTVNGFDLGICDAIGNPITASITSGGAPNAGNPASINTRRPRRWGNTSFYMARKTANQAGVQYCFDFSAPVAGFSMDSREHAYFAQEEAITVTANNAGTPVDLNANYFGSPTNPSQSMDGNGTPEVILNANSTEGGGLWWEVSSIGATVTQVCVQYYSTGGPATAEPFRLLIEGEKCVADDPVVCGGADWVSRWSRLNTTQRTDLLEGTPVYGFNTGFCDESSDAINFLEITAEGAVHSGNPFFKNAKEPRPYALYSFDNGRHFAGMGGNTYCFTLDEARPIRLSSQEHRFFQGGEVAHLSAYLGADPVILEGTSYGGAGPVVGNAGGLTLSGSGYGNDVWWDIDSKNRPVSQVCVEYFVEGGAPLAREPFALGICATRCLNDDPYACSLTGGSCNGFPRIDIQKTVIPLNGYGLDLCNNPGSGLPVFEVTITMANYGTAVKQLFLEEDLMKYFGPAYYGLLTLPVITSSTASGNPMLNPNFNGISDTDIFVYGTGALYSGEEIQISFTVELDPNANGAQTQLLNSVYGGGESGGAFVYNDVSGSSSGGPGQPTPFQNLPPGYTATAAQDLTLEATIPNYMNGINAWLASNGGAAFTVPGCGPTGWSNDYDPANWVFGCGQITGSIEVTFTATNSCGYTFVTCATFTLEDTQGPTCTKPEDLTLDCNAPNALGILQAWLDYDGNYTDLSTPVTFTNDFMGLNGNECNGDPIVVTWTATDACGNETQFSATLTVVDNTPPIFAGVPADLTLDRCDSIPDPASVTVSDGCDLDPDLVFEETTMGDDCHYTITRTWTTIDDCDNADTVSQIITVSDDNPPVFTNVPADVTMECPDVPAAQDPTVTDCSPFTVEFDEVQIGGACPLPSQIVRTWIATDECGNVDSVKQIINMTSPMNSGMITFDPPDPSDLMGECSDSLEFDDVQAMTTCPDGGLSVSIEDVVDSTGDCSQPFSVTRTWIAHDSCGNMEIVSQTIFIGPDTLAPIFHASNPLDINVDCGDDPVLPIAYDNCGPTSLSYVDTDQMGDCDTGFTFIRTWTATDLCGNTSTFAQNVTTSPDTTAPVFLFVPYDQFFDCEDTIVFDDPIVFDNCSDVTLTWQDSIVGTGDCHEVNGQIYGYDIIRTWIATDACGNVATDTTSAWVLPGYNGGNRIAFTHVPADQLIGCGGVIDFGQAICRSACGEITLTFEDFRNTDCDNGTTVTRVWTAVDDCGNTVSATQIITIEPDNEAPVFAGVPADAMFNCTDSAPVFGSPSVTDNCGTGTAVSITYNDVWENGGDCNSFTVTRTWTAVDPCGNESSASQTLTLMDNIAPVFETVLFDKIIGCDDPIIFDQVDVTEECSNAQVSFTDASTNLCDGSYEVIRTWIATDACGNSSSASQTVTVMDTDGPVFDFVPADKTVSCGEAIDFGQAEVSDACSFANLTFTDETAVLCGSTQVVTRMWTATDGCGNISTAQQKITVEDTQAPVFETVVIDLYLNCGETPTFADVEATDACGSVTISHLDTEEVLTCETLIIRTWTATDACGNSAQLSQLAHLMDNDAPVLSTLPSSLEMTQAEFSTWIPPSATATDCSLVTIEVNTSSESNCDFITHIYNYVATDGCGNSTSHILEVLITDAAFAMTVDVPSEMDCGESYDLVINPSNGTAPFAYSWMIVSGDGWEIDAMPGQPIATVLAGEGEAVVSISIMDAFGCVVTQEIILDCEGGVNAVTFAEINSFELKPNPVSDVFTVAFRSAKAGNANLKIVNALGSQVSFSTKAVSLGNNQYEFDASQFPTGTYLLMLQMDGNTAVEKFVKIR